jgi:hypothetical protein
MRRAATLVDQGDRTTSLKPVRRMRLRGSTGRRPPVQPRARSQAMITLLLHRQLMTTCAHHAKGLDRLARRSVRPASQLPHAASVRITPDIAVVLMRIGHGYDVRFTEGRPYYPSAACNSHSFGPLVYLMATCYRMP